MQRLDTDLRHPPRDARQEHCDHRGRDGSPIVPQDPSSQSEHAQGAHHHEQRVQSEEGHGGERRRRCEEQGETAVPQRRLEVGRDLLPEGDREVAAEGLVVGRDPVQIGRLRADRTNRCVDVGVQQDPPHRDGYGHDEEDPQRSGGHAHASWCRRSPSSPIRRNAPPIGLV